MKPKYALMLALTGILLSAAEVNFDKLPAGQLPKGLHSAVNKDKQPGAWVVQEDTSAPSSPNVLVQTDAEPTSQRFPVCVHDLFSAKDLQLSVKFKAISGKKDQAAGLVWRYQDPENYYIVRANALENNVVLYKMENGKRKDLLPIGAPKDAYGKDVKVPKEQWNTLQLVAKGNRFTVSLNGTELFNVEDTTFTGRGKIGLWTKADSVTAFDDLVFTSLD